jgi:hypothetical protein
MEKHQTYNLLFIVGYTILALWAFSAFVRVVWFMPWPGGLFCVAFGIALASFVGWGLVRKVRTGRLPTKEEEQAVIRKGGGAFWSLFGAGVGGGCIAGLIAVIELNDTFSRQAFDRAAGEHAIVFWATVSAGIVIGLGAQIWAFANSSRAPTRPEGAPEATTEASKERSRTNG